MKPETKNMSPSKIEMQMDTAHGGQRRRDNRDLKIRKDLSFLRVVLLLRHEALL
jgi:hypothetical protein